MSRGLKWSPEAMQARGWRDLGASTTPAKAPPAALQPPRAPKRASKGVREVVPYERDVLRAVLAALRAHPRVAWAQRVNSGMAMLPGRGGKPQPVRFGFEGCPDIIGQMRLLGENDPLPWVLAGCPGSFLAVEVKRPGKKPTLAQAAFLLRVRESGGVAFVATSVKDVWDNLGQP